MALQSKILFFVLSICFVFQRCSAFQGSQWIRWKSRVSSIVCATESDHDDPVLRLPLIESELSTMIPSDDEASEKRRQDLQEAVDNARTAAEFGVRRAQVKFYEAFSNGDYSAMEAVWSDEALVRCVHPGMSALEGKDKVMKSWAQIFSQGEPFSIEPSRVHVQVSGRTAVVSCIEETPNGGNLEALNIYRREESSWRMTLHMASPIILQQ